jgi:hypothetical protein
MREHRTGHTIRAPGGITAMRSLRWQCLKANVQVVKGVRAVRSPAAGDNRGSTA